MFALRASLLNRAQTNLLSSRLRPALCPALCPALVDTSLSYIMCFSLLSSKLILTVDSTDDNYMPKRVTVYGGEGDNLKKLSDVTLDE